MGHEGWAGVFVGDFKTELTGMQPMLDRVRNCRFYGRVLLSGMFCGEVGVEEGMGPPWHPTGVYDSTLADCVVEMEALVKGCGLLSRVVVGEHAVVVGNGVVACKGEKEQGGTTAFGCGVSKHQDAACWMDPNSYHRIHQPQPNIHTYKRRSD